MARLALALAFACATSAAGPAAPAYAAVLDADRIDGIEIGIPGTPAGLRASAPDVGMAAGVLVTADGRELWSRFPDDERAMASTTKIMTAIVVLENAKLDDRVTVSAYAAKVGESEAGLVAGKSYTVGKLLEAMLVKSGNDAAFALAEHVGGTIPGFVRMMNDKAAALDLKGTAFKNPHGLDAPGHKTTAKDLATIARYALGVPEFRRMVALPKTTLSGPGGSIITLENSNALLKTYAGADGVKTGWTDDAGYCVVGSATRGGVSLVATVLGAQSESTRFSYARALFDWGFSHYAVTRLTTEGASQGRIPVTDFIDVTVPAVAALTTAVPVFDLAGPVRTRLDIAAEVEAPVAKGQRLGTISVTQGDRLLAQVPVVAAEAVEAPGFWERIGIGTQRLWRRVFGGELVAPPVPAPG